MIMNSVANSKFHPFVHVLNFCLKYARCVEQIHWRIVTNLNALGIALSRHKNNFPNKFKW